tara:strand:+ start:113 stop:823 length:711 start_codon:yes stop_codon:yes gene_type:complete
MKINELQELSKLMYARPNTSDSKAIKEVMIQGSYFRRDFKIEAGENWIDIGGHVGSFTVSASKLGANVKTFEPDEVHYQLLKMNLKNTQTVAETYCAGLGIKNGTKEFYTNENKGNTWRNSFFKKWKKGHTKTAKLLDYKPFITDDICIKMDCEGAEYELLDNFTNIELNKIKKLVGEWSFDIHKETYKFFKIMDKLDSQMKRLCPTDNYIESLKPHKEYPASWFPPAVKFCYVRK